MLTNETIDILGRLDLLTQPKAPCENILIVERDDLPAPRDWHDDLVRKGAQVRTEAWPGYADMMLDPQRTRVPLAVFAGLLGWLASTHRPSPRAAAAVTSKATVAIPATPVKSAAERLRAWAPADAPVLELPDGVVEAAVQIGSASSPLFAVLSTPARSNALRDEPGARRGFVMLNSGSVHHIGPNRLWVVLARRWAARGFTVLRLDLSGIGDSPARHGQPDNIVYSPEALRDIGIAIDHLRMREGIGECHLLGLCSGAFHAFAAAAQGHPVASAVMINPLTYAWNYAAEPVSGLTDYEVMKISAKYRRGFLALDPWIRLVRGQLDLRMIARVAAGAVAGWKARRLMWLRGALGVSARSALDLALDAAARNGVELKFVFAEGHAGHELLRRDAPYALPPLLAQGQASIHLVADADHTFTALDARLRLIDTLDRLLLAGAPMAAPAPAPAPAFKPVRARAATRALQVRPFAPDTGYSTNFGSFA